MPKQTFFNLQEEKRLRITNALIKNFSQKYYDNVDIADVANECKVSKGSMYQYFDDKKEMYFYALQVAYSRFVELLKNSEIIQMSILDYYEKSLESVWFAVKEMREEYILLEKAFFSHDAPFKDEINEKFLKQSREFILEIIKNNQQKGYIRDDIDAILIGIFLEGASFFMKKHIIEQALNSIPTTLDIDVKYLKDILSQFAILLKEGIEKK